MLADLELQENLVLSFLVTMLLMHHPAALAARRFSSGGVRLPLRGLLLYLRSISNNAPSALDGRVGLHDSELHASTIGGQSCCTNWIEAIHEAHTDAGLSFKGFGPRFFKGGGGIKPVLLDLLSCPRERLLPFFVDLSPGSCLCSVHFELSIRSVATPSSSVLFVEE